MKRRNSDLARPPGLGRRLKELRRKRGLSRSQLAKASGLRRRQIVALERGRAVASESELATLAEACGVGVGVLATAGCSVTLVAEAVSPHLQGEVRGDAALDALLREYVSMLLELRNASEIAPVSLRHDDLTELARALGGTPQAIEARLIELLGTDAQGACELRSTILPSVGSR